MRRSTYPRPSLDGTTPSIIKNVQAPASFEDADLFQRTVTIISLQSIDAAHTRVTLVNSGYGAGENYDKLMKVLGSLRSNYAGATSH